MPRRLRLELVGGLYHITNRGVDQLRRPLPQVRVPLESRQRSDELKRKGNAGSGDSLALGLGRRATAEGRRGSVSQARAGSVGVMSATLGK